MRSLMTDPPSTPGSRPYFEQQLTEILEEAVQQGRLAAAVVTTPDGLPIASVESEIPGAVLAGLSSLVAEVGLRSEQLLRWPPMEEMSIVNDDGLRLVVRRFRRTAGQFMLVVLVPANRAYRRTTSQAMRKLSLLLGVWS